MIPLGGTALMFFLRFRMQRAIIRSDTSWPIPVNGVGGIVHSRQLHQEDLNAQIRAMEQQHLQSHPMLQTYPQTNPYGWPTTVSEVRLANLRSVLINKIVYICSQDCWIQHYHALATKHGKQHKRGMKE